MKVTEFREFNDKCTGCLACQNICPVGAIDIVKNIDGFYYPNIHKNMCINCGMCVKVCGIDKQKNINNPYAIFSAKSYDDNIRLKSSSGGIFSILSNDIISKGGIVYGAAYCAENKKIKHVSTDDVCLEEIMRSKYVQSDVEKIYTLVASELKDGRDVLFSGTPCEIRGLKAFLNEKKIESEKLITIDFMCHGVPSPGVFEEFVSDLEKQYNSKVKNVTFREKEKGWHKQVIKAYFQDGRIWEKESLHYYYYYYFLNNYSLRNSCYTCEEYCSHVSDITLADYWNIEPEEDDDKGISIIICNTVKGNDFIDRLKSLANIKNIDRKNFNYNIYSHKMYNYKNKLRWVNCYKKYGINGIKTWFYVIALCKNKIHSFVRMIGGKVKRIVKLQRR
mgnify:FL=1